MARFTCACGGVIPQPLPAKCPHCGRRIAGVRRRAGLPPLVIVIGIFALLIGFAALMAWLVL